VSSVVVAEALPLERPEECTGEGECHGCLQWCSACGDVRYVCTEPGVCSCHPNRDELEEATRDLTHAQAHQARCVRALAEADNHMLEARARVERLTRCRG